ncbi:MAG TPA: phenylalanine--tRNA ligase beta subunit-related protein, partial [Patescibacteria group bacterium]
MKYLYSWLKELYPTIPGLGELESLLIQLGHDVESITPVTYDGVIVAQIQTIEKHPNADRLSLVTITTGHTTHKVVCGAPHLTVGQKVAYAPVGTTLHCGLTLRPISIRGEASEGMLCAPDELGIGTSHEGLLTLPDTATAGEPLDEYAPQDAIISLDITSNRGDVLSHFGLARDLKAGAEQKLLTPSFLSIQTEAPTEAEIGEIHSDVTAFSLASTTDVKSSTTPLYMQSRLLLLGQKPINLATDITNYLQLEYGQPLHAYDAKKLQAPIQISVRRAHQDERIQLLNGKSTTLSPQSLVISSHEHAVALAGVMGGEETKVTKETTDVLLESAHFHAKAVT